MTLVTFIALVGIADAEMQIGMGAARGLGMGPMSHLLRDCQQNGALKVQLAVDLARHASACCGELPEVLAPRFGSTDEWPAHVIDLLTSFIALAKQSMNLCKTGAEAVMAWAELASKSCLPGEEHPYSSIERAFDNVSRAVSLATSMASERLEQIRLVLASLHDRVERHLSGFKLLEAMASGISLSQLVGQDRIQESEPALLVRFFCAAAATSSLELRALVLATHTSWFSENSSSLIKNTENSAQDSLLLSHLQVSGDFLRPTVQDDKAVLKRLEQTSPSPSLALLQALTREEANQTLEDLLVLDLQVQTGYSQATYFADEVTKHLPPGVKVLWLEEFFIKNGPQLKARFEGIASHHDDMMEVVFRPAFGLHTRDAHLWDKAPSVAKQLCASAKRCWRMKPCEEPTIPVARHLEGSLPLDAGCWFLLPSGCPGSDSLQSTEEWRRDKWGEDTFGAKIDATACLDLRRQAFNQWCGVEDVKMHFVSSSSSQRDCKVKIADALQAVISGKEFEGLQRFNAQAKVPGQAFGSYLWWHAKTLAKFREEGQSRARALVWACQPSLPCGGHGDRLKGIVAAFILAVLTGRLFFLDAPDPWDLKIFLEPNLLDWRLAGLAGSAGGRHVLWDHDYFEDTYLDQLLESEEEELVWVIYTNKKSLLGPILRHPILSERAEQLQLLNMPYLTKEACLSVVLLETWTL